MFVVSAALCGTTGAPQKIPAVTVAEDSTVEFALWDGVCMYVCVGVRQGGGGGYN